MTGKEALARSKAAIRKQRKRKNDEMILDMLADISKRVVKNIQEQALANQWIPIAERLPEQNVRVLVFREGNYALSEIYMYDFEGNPLWEYTGLGGNPLYWMPLPEPPKEDER